MRKLLVTTALMLVAILVSCTKEEAPLASSKCTQPGCCSCSVTMPDALAECTASLLKCTEACPAVQTALAPVDTPIIVEPDVNNAPDVPKVPDVPEPQ